MKRLFSVICLLGLLQSVFAQETIWDESFERSEERRVGKEC